MSDATAGPLPQAFQVRDLPCGTASRAATLIPRLAAASRAARIMDVVAELVARDRWNSFDQFARTSRYLQDALKARGLVGSCHPVPTGGGTGDGRWRISWAADVVAGSIDVVSPVSERIADYRENPWTVAHWGLSTAPGGEVLTLRIVDTPEQLQALGPDSLAGCAVLTAMSLYHRPHEWVSRGARAVICDAPVKDCPDATAWTKLGWGGLEPERAGARLPAFALSPPKGQRLRQLCREHEQVRLDVRLDIRDYSGHHDVVSGVLPGRYDPQDEIWAVAHAYEPGAVDNASGVAACVEALGILRSLIDEGTIPAPRRGIRMLAGFECYGFFHYLETVKRLQPPAAGILVDCVGARADVCDATVTWHDSVPGSANFVHGLGLGLFRRAFALLSPVYRIVPEPFLSTEDTLLGDPQYGFPCPFIGSFPYRGYHSSADTIDLLDGQALAATAVGVAAYLYCLADADTEDACEWAAFTRKKWRASSGRRRRKAILDQAEAEASWKGLQRFFWGGDRDEALARIDVCRQAAADPEIPEIPATDDKANARRIRVPFRRTPLAPTYENVPEEIRRRIHRSGVHKWALYWADGQRDLEEIRRLASADAGKKYSRRRITMFFEAMAAIGSVVLVEASELLTREDIVADLQRLGVTPGMDLIVHSSLSAIGWVRGGAETVVDALLEAVGPEGTLLMPSFHHRAADIFNPAVTPTTNGAIPDAFWRRPGVVRSMHPTHAVAACGPRAAEWCANHVEIGIWAAKSPIGRLIHAGGYLLGLGVDHTSSTAYHVAEVSLDAPCLDSFGDPRPVVMPDGSVQQVPGLRWRAGTCPVSPRRLNEDLDRAGRQRHGKVGRADCVLVKAKNLWTMRRTHLKNVCPNCDIRPLP